MINPGCSVSPTSCTRRSPPTSNQRAAPVAVGWRPRQVGGHRAIRRPEVLDVPRPARRPIGPGPPPMIGVVAVAAGVHWAGCPLFIAPLRNAVPMPWALVRGGLGVGAQSRLLTRSRERERERCRLYSVNSRVDVPRRWPEHQGGTLGHDHPRGGNGHAPSTTTNAIPPPVAPRSQAIRDPPPLHACAPAPRLCADQGILCQPEALQRS